MSRNKKFPVFFEKTGTKVLIFVLLTALTGISFQTTATRADADFEVIPEQKLDLYNLPIIQNNSVSSIYNPYAFQESLIVFEKIPVVVTGYSSTPEETDDDPYTTANGSTVKEGIVANNLLAFGTKIRLPEIYGDKIFVVDDRMNPKKGDYHIDIWFPTKEEAKNFGAKITYIEILGS